jgi:hypothetical protein
MPFSYGVGEDTNPGGHPPAKVCYLNGIGCAYNCICGNVCFINVCWFTIIWPINFPRLYDALPGFGALKSEFKASKPGFIIHPGSSFAAKPNISKINAM